VVRSITSGGAFFTVARNYQGGSKIPYTELVTEGSFSESITPDAATLTKTVDVDWGRRREFLMSMLGVTLPNGASARTSDSLSRVAPQAYSAECPLHYCTGADLVQTFGGPRPDPYTTAVAPDCGDTVFSTARYRLTFQQLRYEVASDRYEVSALGAQSRLGMTFGGPAEMRRWIERETHHAGENIPIPSGPWKWVGTSQSIQEGGIPKVFVTRQVNFLWRDIPELCMPVVRYWIGEMLGTVNLSWFDAGNKGSSPRGYPPGTMLLIGADEEPASPPQTTPFFTLSPYGYYHVRFSWLYRNNGLVSGQAGFANAVYAGHNYLYRSPSASPQFQMVTSDGTTNGQPIYRSREHSLLFDTRARELPI